jgi:dolichyl-phosphate beta-glucosyltransferase
VHQSSRGAAIEPSPPVTLVVPCFNEATRLDVKALCAWVDSVEGHRLILVDDGSTDATRDRLHALRASAPGRVEVLELPHNVGKAEAVRRALRSHGALVGYWDADLATPLDEVEGFVAVFARLPMCDLVLGSRVKLLGRRIERRPVRHYLGRVFATLASMVLRLPVYDTQCGAKMFRVNERTRPLFESPFLSRWVFDVEVLARYMGVVGRIDPAEKRVVEYPLRAWRDVAGSKVRAVHFLTAIGDLVRISRHYR